MGDLAQVTHQHVLLAVMDRDAAVLIERMSAYDSAPVLYAIGDRLPLHSTGVGLALLAFAPLEVQQDYLDRPLLHEPENDSVDIEDLRRRLAGVRREGFAIVHRAAFSVISVAAPVFGSDELITGALSVVLPPRGSDLVFWVQPYARQPAVSRVSSVPDAQSVRAQSGRHHADPYRTRDLRQPDHVSFDRPSATRN